MNADHRGKRRWRRTPDPSNTYADAERRVRREDRRHRCHARCEHAREVAASGARGCSNCLTSLPLILGVLAAIIIAIAAATGKL